ncbi:MAG: elongation factor Ts, partial [Casimicrobiaceae bacterium]
QVFVKSDKETVGGIAKANGATINGFVLYVVGEGIEKRKDDFAAEVAAMSRA